MKSWLFGAKKIPEEELKANKGFMLAQDHLLHRIDQECVMGPVVAPTGMLLFCSGKFLKNVQLRSAAICCSLAIGAKLYLEEFRRFDLNVEKTYKVLLCPTPMGKECRDILKEHDPDHWILDEYEVEAQKLRTKLAKTRGGVYSQWKDTKRYSEDIWKDLDTVTPSSSNTNSVRAESLNDDLNEESLFLKEYPLPTHELTYATKGLPIASTGDNEYEEGNVINIRPETRFMKTEMWPQALVESEEFRKREDEDIFRSIGVDVEDDQEMQRELLADIPKADLYSDEQCWQIEEEWRKCKLMVRRGKTKASECKKLKSDMKMCRGLAAMSRLKAL